MKKISAKSGQPSAGEEMRELREEVRDAREELARRNGELARAREEIAARREMYAELYDFAPVGYFRLDRDGSILGVNIKGAQLLGAERSRLVKRRLGAFISKADRPVFKDFLGAVFETGAKKSCEVRLRKDGLEPVYVRIEGGVGLRERRCLAVIRDVTDRRKAQEELRINLAKYQVILESLPLGISITDASGNIVECNGATERLLGDPRWEPDGRRPDGSRWRLIRPDGSHLPVEERPGVLALRENRLVENLEIGVLKNDDQVTWLNVTAAPIPLEGYGAAIAYGDISGRKRLEMTLLESEEKYRNIFSAARDAILMLEPVSGKILDVNPSACALCGYTRGELLGMRVVDLSVEPDKTAALLMDEVEWIPLRYLKRKDGAVFPAEISVSSIIRGGRRIITTMIRDISERKRAEEERDKLEVLLRQAEKIEALGTLAGGIAHDFNNILGAIIGFTDMALDEIPEGSLPRKDLEQVRKASNRAKDLVKQILAFSRQGESHERQPVELGPIVKEALKMLRAALPSTIELRKEIIAEPRRVMADPTQIHQVVVNLCANAAHAMSEHGGVLEVKMADVELDAREAKKHGVLKPGSYLRLSVGDTGHGMDRATMERIFDPYFTTKGVGEGSGLGLAVVHGIAQRHQGAVTVESEPGKGSVFHVFLPRVESVSGPLGARRAPTRKGSERILFVDDEEALTTLNARMLRSLGYRVTATTESLDALHLFRAEPEAFDLIITDYTMPHMTGLDLSREVLLIRPDMPIILCTGFSAGIDPALMRATGIREVAIKPLGLDNISEIVGKVLDEAARKRRGFAPNGFVP
jgi:PAS domain S-box-containing protein